MVRKHLPEAPPHLSETAREWWNKITAGWDLDDAGLLILQAALESFDRAEQARSIIAADGLFLDGKPHPAARIERDARAAMLTALKQLHLDVEPVGPVGRPSTLGRR
jgi:phage terminase small subunit